ncbi:hypothetical protein MMC21_007106 [Puttea exsequens]|nr:hypothetical protein [Puttea exsequens]
MILKTRDAVMINSMAQPPTCLNETCQSCLRNGTHFWPLFLATSRTHRKPIPRRPNSSGVSGDVNGVPSTKYCIDGGVYHLSKIEVDNTNLVEPIRFHSLSKLGAYSWWPTLGSAPKHRSLIKDSIKIPAYDTLEAEDACTAFVSAYTRDNTDNILQLVGKAPGSWSLPVCDQGYNSWKFDYKGAGGLIRPQPAPPCTCGWNGTGTTNFWKATGGTDQPGTFYRIVGACRQDLLSIFPGLIVD